MLGSLGLRLELKACCLGFNVGVWARVLSLGLHLIGVVPCACSSYAHWPSFTKILLNPKITQYSSFHCLFHYPNIPI